MHSGREEGTIVASKGKEEGGGGGGEGKKTEGVGEVSLVKKRFGKYSQTSLWDPTSLLRAKKKKQLRLGDFFRLFQPRDKLYITIPGPSTID